MKQVPGFDLFIDDDLVCYRYKMNSKGVRSDRLSKAPIISDGKGYLIVPCRNDENKPVNLFYHRAVALAFISNPEGKPTVDHIDRNPLNCVVSNLRWADYCEQNSNTSRADRSVERFGVHSTDSSYSKIASSAYFNEHREAVRLRHNEYYNKNKEAILARHAAYREANRDTINERRRISRRRAKEQSNA